MEKEGFKTYFHLFHVDSALVVTRTVPSPSQVGQVNLDLADCSISAHKCLSEKLSPTEDFLCENPPPALLLEGPLCISRWDYFHA